MTDRAAPETAEIEVTPEMIEAGAAEIASYSPEATTAEAMAEDVFRAMLSAVRRRSGHNFNDFLLGNSRSPSGPRAK